MFASKADLQQKQSKKKNKRSQWSKTIRLAILNLLVRELVGFLRDVWFD